MSAKGRSSKSRNSSKAVRESKRAKFSQPAKKRNLPLPALIVVGVAILVGAGVMLWRGARASGQAIQFSNDAELVQPVADTANTDSPSTQPTDDTEAVQVAADPADAAEAADTGDTAEQDEVVRLSVATFDDGKAHFYSHQVGETAIEYFVLKSSDGVLRAAFNACDVCFEARKGYRQEGDQMICNNCGLAFPSTQINEVRGGCNPAPLDRAVEGDELVIRVDDILSGIRYFQ